MLSFPIADKHDLYGVININSTSIKTFSDDEIYFTSIIANLILTAVKLRRKAASTKHIPPA
jgi:putative methionine-R-sulfoxide reductase with GAF domain